MKGSLSIRLAPWIATVALFLFWEAVVRIFNIPQFFLPPPSLVFRSIIDYWPALYRNSLFTLSTTLVGFGLAVGFGLLLGLALASALASIVFLVWMERALADLEARQAEARAA